MAFLAPGAYWRELDYSNYALRLSTSIFGAVGGAEWGPMNEPTLITNEGALTRTFGPLAADDMGLYGVQRYLRRGRQCYYVRIGSSTPTKEAVKATVDIEDAGGFTVMTFDGLYEGAFGNFLQIDIQAAAEASRYNVRVLYPADAKGSTLSSELFTAVHLTDPNDSRYIEKVINEGTQDFSRSAWVRVTVIDPMAIPVSTISPLPLTGGNSGKTDILASDYIGTVFGNQRTGLQAFNNPDKIDLNLVACPGESDKGVIRALIELCEKQRRDCMALIDPPQGLTVQGVIDWHNDDGEGAALNSSYAALYWPWCQIDDPYSGQEVWVPPSGFAVESMAYTDEIAEPWFAPAGFQRGRVNANRAEYQPDLGEREAMCTNQNAINPITTFERDGLVIYGQKTLQREPTALDRVNVRRGLLQLEKQVATAIKYLTFEPNDPLTWRRFVSLVQPHLDYMTQRRGLRDSQVICDESTNPDYLYDNNEMHGKILLKPTKAAEVIVADFTLVNSGADFSEYVNV